MIYVPIRLGIFNLMWGLDSRELLQEVCNAPESECVELVFSETDLEMTLSSLLVKTDLWALDVGYSFLSFLEAFNLRGACCYQKRAMKAPN